LFVRPMMIEVQPIAEISDFEEAVLLKRIL
jgi:hypothetical protein